MMSKRSVSRAAVTLAVVLAVLVAASPAGLADHNGPKHVVCIHAYYEYPPGSPREYVINECRVGTDWEPVVSEDDACEVTTIIKVCYGILVSAP